MTTVTTVTTARQGGKLARWAAGWIHAAKAGAQWRLLLLWLAALALPLLLALLPFTLALADRLNHSLLAAAWVSDSEASSLVEILTTLGAYHYSPAAGGISALFLVLLLSPWLTGMVMAAARSPVPLRFGALLKGGLADYGRMARMLLWAAVPLGAAGAAAAGLGALASHHAEAAILESDAQLWNRLALAGGALLLILAHATVDAARAQMVIEPRRRSVVRAWARAVRSLAQRPARLLDYGVISIVGLLLAAAWGFARLQVAPAGAFSVAGAVILGQLIALSLIWMRCARLFALVASGRQA
jgi:hypothetical protein